MTLASSSLGGDSLKHSEIYKDASAADAERILLTTRQHNNNELLVGNGRILNQVLRDLRHIVRHSLLLYRL